jgi:hypothetical protein
MRMALHVNFTCCAAVVLLADVLLIATDVAACTCAAITWRNEQFDPAENLEAISLKEPGSYFAKIAAHFNKCCCCPATCMCASFTLRQGLSVCAPIM